MLTELWGSLALNIILSAIFYEAADQFMALAMVGWLWPLRAFRQYLQKISGKTFAMKIPFIALSIGGFLSVALATFGQPFSIYSLPLSLAVAGTGLFIVNESRRQMDVRSGITWVLLLATAIFFAEKVAFPWWRLNENFGLVSLSLDLVLYMTFAGTTIALVLELMKKEHDVELATMVKERNQKLYSQSKYSELGMMSAGIAHEINNPLAVIQARTTQLLRLYRMPEKIEELGEGLHQILYTSERINRTIQGVREFVHQDDNAAYQEVGLKDLVDDVLVFCGQRLKNHGINLRFYGLENFTVLGNKIQLEQVLLNLINNSFDAIEFLPDKWIELSVEALEGKVKIFFKDSGAGIPPEIAERIMEPFFSTKELRKGTGLGLAIARRIIEQHGGKLNYIPNSAHTTFCFELPLKPEKDWGVESYH